MSIYYQRMPLSEGVDPRILTDTVRQRARIGRNHWKTSFSMIPKEMPYRNPLRGYCRTMHEQEPRGGGVILRGDLGSGKTSIAALVLKWCLAKGGRSLFFRASELIDQLLLFNQPLLPNGAPLRDGLYNVNYLVIDDVVAEEKPDRRDKLEQVVRRRYDDLFPTIITTNLERERLNEVAWMKSLLENDLFYKFEVTGLNWRKNPPDSPPRRSLL